MIGTGGIAAWSDGLSPLLADPGVEAVYVANTLPAIEPEWPAMSWAGTLGNLRVMDAWNASLRAQAQL